jgi:hypothetical protein
MFELEQSIAEWRRQMLAAGIKSPVPLDELELHLRDDIERQMKSGRSKAEAFEISVGGIGPAGPLRAEFEKDGHLGKARQRKWAGIVFAAILGLYFLAVACVLFKNNLTFDERLSGFASVATMLVSAFIAWKIAPRFFPVLANYAVQSAIGIIGSISGMGWFLAFACLILPRVDFTQAQLLVMTLWAIVPVMLLPTISFLVIDKSERQQLTTGRS